MEKVCVILPAYNEEKSIGKVIDEIQALPYKYDILVVDNNSKNGTAEIIKSKNVKVVECLRQGKGCAIKKGFFEVSGYEAVVMLDADYTYPAYYIPILIEQLKTYDVVLGYRWRKDKGSMTLVNLLGNQLLTQMANILYGTHIHDLCTGLWAFKQGYTSWLSVMIESEGFTLEAEMLAKICRLKAQIGEVPIIYRPREGKAKLRVVDGFRIGACLLKEKLGQLALYRDPRIFREE